MRYTILACALTAVAPRSAVAQKPAGEAVRAPVVAVTHHSGRLNGARINYTATVAEHFLKDASGAPTAALVTISYVRDDAAERSGRPVMFVLPGGPGGSSASLELAAFGPKRIAFDSGQQQLVTNEQSPLDAVDLVFVDPVGTGYADPFAGVDGRQFWGRTSDALSIKAVIADWLVENGRERSPRFLLGHSYGTTRAAMIIKNYPELNLTGLLLFALVANAGSRDMGYATALPTFATAAWYHQRIPRSGRSVEEVYEETVRFVRTEYGPAIAQGSGLDTAERRRVAERMSTLIGLPSQTIEASDVRISKQAFMTTLLKDKGLRTGLLDMRATGRLDAPPQPGPYGDPGMPAPVAPDVISRYFENELGFRPRTTYQSLNLDVNRLWDNEGGADVSRLVADAMNTNPRMRLFWLAGYFDLTTPAFSARYALEQAGIPLDRLTTFYVAAGHTISRSDETLGRLSQAVRDFVRRR